MDDDTGDIADRIEQAIAAGIKAGELGDDTAGMPAGFALVATYYDSEGKVCTILAANTGALVHETLGLVNLGRVAWEAEALDWVRGE